MGSDDDRPEEDDVDCCVENCPECCCTGVCGVCGCARVMFGIFNGLYWAISLTLLGMSAWLASGNEAFAAGTAIFTYCCLAVSSISFIMCVLGFIGSIFENMKVLGSYLIIFVLVLFTQIGLNLACFILYSPNPIDLVNQVWTESNDYFRDKAQTELTCCGFETAYDTYDVSSIPASCSDENDVLYTAGCGDAIVTFFTSSSIKPHFATVLILLGIIEFLAFITGAIYFHGLREKLKSEDLEEEEGAGRTSRNKVAPITVVREPSPTVSEPPHHREESKVRRSVARSVASRRDVDFDVRSSSGKESRASETKGNEALFKVAGVMLDTEA